MSPMFGRCEDCGGERLFEQPHQAPGSCPDSPDGRCPEWSCTECGAGNVEGQTAAPRSGSFDSTGAGTALPAVFWPVPAQLAPVPAVAGQVA